MSNRKSGIPGESPPAIDAAGSLARAGEVRINLIRLAAILIFYAQHCFSYYVLQDPAVTTEFHAMATFVTATWACAVALVYHMSRQSRLPAALPAVLISVDLFLTLILISRGDGPKSALILLLPLIAFSSALRHALREVYVSTAGAILVYGISLATYVWLTNGREAYYSKPELRIPRTEQLIVVGAILVSGLLAGQVVRERKMLLLIRKELDRVRTGDER